MTQRFHINLSTLRSQLWKWGILIKTPLSYEIPHRTIQVQYPFNRLYYSHVLFSQAKIRWDKNLNWIKSENFNLPGIMTWRKILRWWLADRPHNASQYLREKIKIWGMRLSHNKRYSKWSRTPWQTLRLLRKRSWRKELSLSENGLTHRI